MCQAEIKFSRLGPPEAFSVLILQVQPVLKIARTIADLDHGETVNSILIAAGNQYFSLESKGE